MSWLHPQQQKVSNGLTKRNQEMVHRVKPWVALDMQVAATVARASYNNTSAITPGVAGSGGKYNNKVRV